MRIRRLYLNRLDADAEPRDVVVVIDVLRSFSTAAHAFAAGAAVIHPVATLSEALALRARLPGALATGALPGGDPAPGFDFGNSPAAIRQADLRGRPLVQCTAAGVRGLARFARARALFAGSLNAVGATARAIAALAPEEVCLVITGEWVDRDGDEDVACADHLAALLGGAAPDPAQAARRVRDSDFGRRFLSGRHPNLPAADLELCAAVDCVDFAMPVTRGPDGLVMRAQPDVRPAGGADQPRDRLLSS